MSWLLALLIGCGGSEAPQGVLDPLPISGVRLGAELPAPTSEKLAASHVLITWNGAATASVSVSRTKEEALALAQEVHAKAVSGTRLADLAKAHSDGPSAPRGGKLGVWQVGTMVPSFERCTAAAEVGAISPLCETAFGYHVIQREEVFETRARHVLVPWKGAWRSAASRTKDEARARIGEAATKLDKGTSFNEVAKQYSEDATAAHGGDLGLIAPGQLVPAFEDRLFELEPGQVSGVVETPYGFHLIRRDP